MTFSIHTFEISKNLETEGTRKRSTLKLSRGVSLEDKDNGYYRQISLIINPSKLLGGDDLDLWKPKSEIISKVNQKLEKVIDDYSDSDFCLNDFELTRCGFTVNIRTGSKKKVAIY